MNFSKLKLSSDDELGREKVQGSRLELCHACACFVLNDWGEEKERKEFQPEEE